jgi:hypothetical protein
MVRRHDHTSFLPRPHRSRAIQPTSAPKTAHARSDPDRNPNVIRTAEDQAIMRSINTKACCDREKPDDARSQISNVLNCHSRRYTVPWYDYIASFFAGMFLANAVPHFVHGISGDRFPTPFSNPPGKGLSSPTMNVVWALFNLVIGYFLFQVGKISSGERLTLLVFFAGIVVIGIMGSRNFATKHTR